MGGRQDRRLQRLRRLQQGSSVGVDGRQPTLTTKNDLDPDTAEQVAETKQPQRLHNDEELSTKYAQIDGSLSLKRLRRLLLFLLLGPLDGPSKGKMV